MIYVTVRQSPTYRQMSLEDLWFGNSSGLQPINKNTANTRTYKIHRPSFQLISKFNLAAALDNIERFVSDNACLYNAPREELYSTFYIEKKNKGVPYIFSQMFKAQHRYVECDKTSVCRVVGSTVREMARQHPTDKDEAIVADGIRRCVNCLMQNGLEMTETDFRTIFKGAFRRIDAPSKELKDALNRLKSIFESDFGALYHTSAFAYVQNRSAIDAVKRHQANESRWFAKLDLTNFFGSTTIEFIMKMFSIIFPFSEIVKSPYGRKALENALSLCTLNGVLPQGTPISPLITNIMMIPIDHELSNGLRDFNSQKFIYTRYADDFLISSKYNFDPREIETFLVNTLREFDAPFTIKSEKTRYGSSAGSNWNLGVMLNKDNKITIGYENKRRFQAMLASYVMDRKNGNRWDYSDIQRMEGYRCYYKMVEGDTIDKIVEHVGQKFNVNIVRMIKEDLRS